MSSAFKEQLGADIKAAMKGGDKTRLGTLRLISAAVKQFEVDQREELDDERAVELLTRMCKQRRESIAQYEGAGRDDLATREADELALIQGYLPAQLTDEEISTAVSAAIAKAGASSPRDMGKVMGILGAELKGRADMGRVSALVKGALSD